MSSELQSALSTAAETTKRVCATSADVIKDAKQAAAAKATSTGVKAYIAAHSVGIAAIGGVIVGIAAYHLVNKFWLNKDDSVEQNTLKPEAPGTSSR